MKQNLQECIDFQLANEQTTRKISALEHDGITKLSALFYTVANQNADLDKIKKSREILKNKMGIFSNFRGAFDLVISSKMSLAEDPEKYLDDVIDIYKKLVSDKKIPGETYVMTAITIYEQARDQDIDSIINQTKEAYAKIKEQHKYLTDETDMSFIAMMVMSGKDIDKTVNEVEETFNVLKQEYKVPSDAAQGAALVLSMSDKSVQEKCKAFMDLYTEMKAKKQQTSKNRCMVIYAACVVVNMPQSEVVEAMSETELILKKHQGYGALTGGQDIRRVFAGALVILKQLLSDGDSGSVGRETNLVSNVVTQEVIDAIMLMVYFTNVDIFLFI